MPTQSAINVTARSSSLVQSFLGVESFILDGELIALGENGLHSFSLLQRRATKTPLHF